MKEESQREEYLELFNTKKELHKLMRRVIVSTKLGRQNKAESDLSLGIGNGELISCIKYGQVRFCVDKEQEGTFEDYHQLDDNCDVINYLIIEIKKRFANYQKDRDSHKIEYIQGKKKFATKYFSVPLNIKFEEVK